MKIKTNKMKNKIMKQTAVKWNIENPKKVDNYIVDLGADGVSLAWYNGKDWIKMWDNFTKLKVNGWIKIPKYKTI